MQIVIKKSIKTDLSNFEGWNECGRDKGLWRFSGYKKTKKGRVENAKGL